jgi:hypothetical protein
VSDHIHFPATLSRGKNLRFSLQGRLDGPLSRYDAAEDGTTYLPRLETTPQLFHRPALKLGYNCSHVNFSVGVLLQARAMAIDVRTGPSTRNYCKQRRLLLTIQST